MPHSVSENATDKRTAVIIGAGPAGLTAGYELLEKTDVQPIIFEAADYLGGISRTINYKGNRIDIGGHRFFSKSDRVMDWWSTILPVEKTQGHFTLKYQGRSRDLEGNTTGADPDKSDDVMLIRRRTSRIYYMRKLFNYPVRLEAQTIKNLGARRMTKIGFSYLKARLVPLEEKSLEEFFVNRFGRELYNTFFRDYTEKVWGLPASEIASDWGAQRVKGLSITKALTHALRQAVKPHRKGIQQKDTETSLIEYFLYPKYGPGQMWEKVAALIEKRGGEVHNNVAVTKLHVADQKIVSVTVTDLQTGSSREVKSDYFFSTMPVKELIAALDGVPVPQNVQEVADGLVYRDFITVGLLLTKLKIKNQADAKTAGDLIQDNWIYIQESDVKVGRLQIFNNWSPYLITDQNRVWVGMEYFTNEGDELWQMSDSAMAQLGVEELAKIGIIEAEDVLDSTVIRMKKTYPAYFGTYGRFDEIRCFTDEIDNLFLVGRNGMHRYNNQDHSMLTAMTAVENIAAGRTDKDNIWSVNIEPEYHEERK